LTLAPDRHRLGSNCILATPASAFKFHYGADSCNRHLQQAAKSEFDAKVVLNTATACDIDYPEDLVFLLEHAHWQVAQNTINYLNEQGIAKRLNVGESNLTPLQGRQYERVS
jgi:2-phospho-L-lactate guanylyltransferase